jgi:hypothetical protein
MAVGRREVHSIGILYTRKGTPADFERHSSIAFVEFLSSLGWRVRAPSRLSSYPISIHLSVYDLILSILLLYDSVSSLSLCVCVCLV